MACYQDAQITCNTLNSNGIKKSKPRYSINPIHETAKNLNNGHIRFENEENSDYPQESRDWKTVTSYSSKNKN